MCDLLPAKEMLDDDMRKWHTEFELLESVGINIEEINAIRTRSYN